MKRMLTLVLATLLSISAMVTSANAIEVSIGIGDRPYYVHGPYYYVGPVRYVWVPGHFGYRHHTRVWIHGYYVAR